jgi:predicted AAA+ superfamily ATPase
MPKGIVRDSGINNYLSGIDGREKLLRSPQVGQNFEAFVIEEIIKGLQATSVTRWDYFYFRTKNGAEVDLILEGSFGTLPIEIKLGQQTTLRQLTSLQQFVKRNNLPFGIIINNSTEVRMLGENVVQLPAGCI